MSLVGIIAASEKELILIVRHMIFKGSLYDNGVNTVLKHVFILGCPKSLAASFLGILKIVGCHTYGAESISRVKRLGIPLVTADSLDVLTKGSVGCRK